MRLVSANPAKQIAPRRSSRPSPRCVDSWVCCGWIGDINSVILFAFVAGLLSLASPLAVESLVNVVSWGVYLQPLFVLALLLFVFLGLSAVLSVLQSVVVEIIQRRQFVRIVCDLAHRFPRANRQQLEAEFQRELANRLLDIMTIQKATATLLLEGISIVLMTGLGLVLLGFYHPFLLGFDLILVVCMTVITWFLGWGGINTSIRESRIKYRMVHWLQDIIDSPVAFRINGGPIERLFGCGTGIKHYQIAPGQTAEFHVSPYGLPITPKADDKVAIGFHIGPISGEGRSPVFSEPFTLPEEFINQKRERELFLLNQQ